MIFDNINFINRCSSLDKNSQKPKILLIQMPQIDIEVLNMEIAKAKGYYLFPPSGLQYVYEEIKHRDVEIQIIDLNFEILKLFLEDENFDPRDWLEILKKRIEEFNPTIFAVSCLFDFSIRYFLEILEYLKKESNSIVIAGGVIATFEWKNLIEKDLAHFVITGEAENKINFLLDYITNENLNTKPEPNIYYKYNDEVEQTKGHLGEVDFNTSLIDSYKLFPISEYNLYGSLNPFSRTIDGVLKFAVIQRSRGCRAHCTFCSVEKIMGAGVRIRTNKSVLDEMEFLIDEHKVTHFEWLDDDLLFDAHEFKGLLREIVAKKWNISWSANNGLIATYVDDEMLKLISDSGCIGFKIGVETGNKEMLQDVKKPASLGAFLKLSEKLVDYPKIFVGGNIIIGLPKEKFYMLMDTFKFSIKMNYDWAVFTTCQAIRGASAFSEMGEYFENQMETKDGANHNFIPTRLSKKGHIETSSNIKKGLDVFLIDKDEIPNPEQVQELWFSFNLIVNFIFNKNLYPDGHRKKFISWVETARKAYPYSPYMLLFLAIAYKMQGEEKLAQQRYKIALTKIDGDSYWESRMKEFGLMKIVEKFNDEIEIHIEMNKLRSYIRKRLEGMGIYV